MPARLRGGLRVMRVAHAVAARGGTTSMTSRGSLPCPGPAVRVLLLVGACAATPPGVADEAVLLSEQEFYAPLPVVLTASRLAQSLDDAPAAVSVIDRQMISASGARNLSELFRLVPGFMVGFESGHRHVVTYHGLADQFARRLQVLIDGRSVYLPSYGGVSWSDLPVVLDDIERIEVIRGPNAATYGTNAFLATISISTRHAAAEPGGFVRASAGSNDIRDGVLRTAGGSETVQYRLTAGYQQDSGYQERNDDRQVMLVNGRVDARAGDGSDIEYQFGYNGGPRGRGFADDPLNWPHDQEITSRFQQLRWRQRLASGDELAVQLYYNHHESDEQVYTLTSPSVLVNYDLRSERYDGEFQYTLGLGDELRIVSGIGARLDRALWPGFLGSPDNVDHRQYRAFASLEWRIAAPLVMNAGAMYEHSEITGSSISPRLALNYRLAPGHTVRVSVSSATRQPVLLEEQGFARFCIDPPDCNVFTQTFASSGGLDPEQITTSELGYVGQPLSALTVDLRVFRDRITRLIGAFSAPYAETPAPFNDGEAYDFRNSDKATLTGSELQLDYHPRRDTRLMFNYANVLIDSTDVDAVYSNSAPRHNLSLLGLYDLGHGWQASAAFYYQDQMAYLDEDEQIIGPLRRLDLRLAWRFALPGASAEAALVLQNVLKEQASYYVDYADSVTARSGYFTLSMQMH